MNAKRGAGIWVVAVVLLWGCGEVTIQTPPPTVIVETIEGETPVVNVYPTTVVQETVTIVEEDSTPDVVYEVSGDPVPALIYEEGGTVAKKFSDLAAATTFSLADIMAITQGGTSKKLTFDAFPLPTNWIGGLICSYAADPDNDITVSVGSCRDVTDTVNIRLAAAITKQLDAAWAVGTNQGGIDAGAMAASTLYAVWIIKRSDTGVVDVLFSTSFTAPAMPANYDYKRLIGAIATDIDTDIMRFKQVGDYFVYLNNHDTDGAPWVISDATLHNNTWETASVVYAPPWSIAHLLVRLDNTTSTSNADGVVYVRTPPPTSWSGQEFARMEVNAVFDKLTALGDVLVNASSQVDYAASEITGNAIITIAVVGFRMLTRNEPQ